MKYDVMVVGGGIAGMESGLTLGDMGFNVLMVEKKPSVGGRMILLSKVFPTLDCASCVSAPKMSATGNHPRVDLQVNSEVKDIRPQPDGTFKAKLVRKATFVDPAACTGCAKCETVCTVATPDHYNYGLAANRAIHIAFPQAVPKKAVITKEGSSPCSYACPAGVQTHGYVSLVRAGKYAEAFHLHMEDAPLPGSLSRACYAPCEGACTRGDLEGNLSIRGIKRFMVDRYYSEHLEPEYGIPEALRSDRIAIVGSGPAGLSAAYFLAQKGYPVTIFEADAEPGGMLRHGLPSYRLPREIVDRDIKNVTALGVEIRTGTVIGSLEEIQKEGFAATFLAVGTMEGQGLDVPGRDLAGVVDAMDFLSGTHAGKRSTIAAGKRVVVVGGGNVAIDAARVALRQGATRVSMVYRRTRLEMPAHKTEIADALAEGIELQELRSPAGFVGQGGQVVAARWQDMRLGAPDASGRRRPEPVPHSIKEEPADLIILAIGLMPSRPSEERPRRCQTSPRGSTVSRPSRSVIR